MKSLFGEVLVALARYDEAEVVLLEAHRDLGALPQPPRRDVDATVGRLSKLYQAWGKPDKVAAYRTSPES